MTGDGSSVSILSVEISQIVWSSATCSPMATSHLRTVPSDIEVPSWGMTTSTRAPSVGEEVSAGIAYAFDVWEDGVFEWGAEGDWDVGGCESVDWGVEVLEGVLGDQCGERDERA